MGQLYVHVMKGRPLSVTVIGWLFLVTGAVGLAYHATEFKFEGSFPYELVLVLSLRLLALVCGVFLLRGANWARWLALAWMGYHVVLSAFHPLFELAVHSLLLAAFAYFLLRPQASACFRRRRAQAAQAPTIDDTS